MRPAGRRRSCPARRRSRRRRRSCPCARRGGAGQAGGGPASHAAGSAPSCPTPRSSNQTCPDASRPRAVNRPGFSASRLSVWVARTASARAGVGVQARGQVHRQHRARVRRSVGDAQFAIAPSSGRAPPMPSSASIARSHCAGGAAANATPASRARCSEASASAGARASSPSQVTTGFLPHCCRCSAASMPSPPLLPGPQAIQIVRAMRRQRQRQPRHGQAGALHQRVRRQRGRSARLDGADRRDVEERPAAIGRDALHTGILAPPGPALPMRRGARPPGPRCRPRDCGRPGGRPRRAHSRRTAPSRWNRGRC